MLGIDLSNRIAIVTGASGGIGSQIVSTLVQAGATVAALDLTTKPPAGLDAEPSAVHRFAADVTDEVSVAAAVQDLSDSLGLPTIVINNAGVAGRVGMPFTRLDAADWQSAWDVNVVGTFNVSAAAVPAMIEAGSGAIVNVSSVSGRTGFQTSPPYSASKAAVINFTQVMSRALAKHSIRVNAICPGMVFTPFYRAQRLAAAEADPSLLEVTDEEYFTAKATSIIPLGRGQTPAEIANAAVFLASDMAGAITGQSLNVDGGLVMS